MKLKIFGLLIFMIFLVGGWFFFLRKDQSQTLVSPAWQQTTVISSVSPTATPTPVPKVVIDHQSNLEEETERLTPEAFSEDFELLQEQINSL